MDPSSANRRPDSPCAFDFIEGRDATEDFDDAGHSKSAKELMETFFIGELEIEIVEKQPYARKLMELTKQYWVFPAAVVGVSVVVGFLYLRKK